MIQLIVAGMPQCGKTTAIQKLLKGGLTDLPPGIKADNIGERNRQGFSYYELVALACDKHANDATVIDWVATTKHTSYTYSILSGMLRKIKPSDDQPLFQKSPSDDPDDGFPEEILNNHFQELYSRLYYLTQVHIPRSRVAMDKLKHGLSIVNIWDIGISASLLHMLPQLIGYFDHSFPMLALSLDRDSGHMTERFVMEDFEIQKDLEVIKMHRIRENYVFRFAHMAKSNFKQRDRKVCKIVFFTQEEYTEEKKQKAKELMKNEILHRAELYGVSSLIDETPILCNSLSSESVQCLRTAIEQSVLENKDNVRIDVPISWMFLRSAVYATGKMFIKTDEFKALAQHCNIDEKEFENFLRAFTSMGSLIYAPSLEALKKYVILNPFDFFKKLNELFCPYFDGDLRFGLVTPFSLRRMFSSGDELKFFQALLASCHFAVKLNTSRFLYNEETNYPTKENCFYIPAIRKEYNAAVDVLKVKHSLLLVKSRSFPPGDIPPMIVETLLCCDHDKEVHIVASEYFNVTTFYHKSKQLKFDLVSHGSVIELCFSQPIECIDFKIFLVKMLRRAMLKVQRILGEPDKLSHPFTDIFAIPCISNISNGGHIYEKYHLLHQYSDTCCGRDNQWINVSCFTIIL